MILLRWVKKRKQTTYVETKTYNWKKSLINSWHFNYIYELEEIRGGIVFDLFWISSTDNDLFRGGMSEASTMGRVEWYEGPFEKSIYFFSLQRTSDESDLHFMFPLIYPGLESRLFLERNRADIPCIEVLSSVAAPFHPINKWNTISN